MRLRCYYHLLDEVGLETVRVRVHVVTTGEPVGEPSACRDLGIRATVYPDANAVVVVVGGGGPVVDLSWVDIVTGMTWEDAERLAEALGYSLGRDTGTGIRVNHAGRVVYVGGWPKFAVSGGAGRASITVKKGRTGFSLDIHARARRPLIPALTVAIPAGRYSDVYIDVDNADRIAEIAEYVARVRNALRIHPRF